MKAGSLVMLGGVAVGGYFLYENLFGLPADAMFVSAIPAGQSVTLPDGSTATGLTYVYHSGSTGLYYSRSTAPTSAQVASTAVATSTGTTGSSTNGTTPAVTTTPATTPTVTGSGTLAGIYVAMKAAAAGDANFTGAGDSLTGSPYHFNFYLSRLLPSGLTAPDPTVVFGVSAASTPMTAAAYWAAMAPYLTTNLGLSGLAAVYSDSGDDITDVATLLDAGNASLGAPLLGAGGGGAGSGQQVALTATTFTPWVLAGLALAGIAVMSVGGRR